MLDSLQNIFQDFMLEEDGATAVEYAIMLVLIIAVVIAVVGLLGEKTTNSFEKFNNEFTKATN